MLHAVTTGAYNPPVVTTWKVFTTGESYLTTGTLCTVRGTDYKERLVVKMKPKRREGG